MSDWTEKTKCQLGSEKYLLVFSKHVQVLRRLVVTRRQSLTTLIGQLDENGNVVIWELKSSQERMEVLDYLCVGAVRLFEGGSIDA